MSPFRRPLRSFAIRITLACNIFLAIVYSPREAFGQVQHLTPAEQLVIHQLTQGEPADLAKFGEDERTLDPDFVAQLLVGNFKTADTAHSLDLHGIVISYAIFEDSLNIHFEVPYPVHFMHCQFRKGIDVSGAQFDKDLIFERGHFGPDVADAKDESGEVEFTDAIANGAVSFLSVSFRGPLDFTRARIRELNIQDGRFEWSGADPEIDFTAAHIDSDLSLSVNARQPRQIRAQFLNVGGSAQFGSANTAFFATDDFDLTYSRFQNLDIFGFDQWLRDAQDDSVSLDGFSFQEIYLPSRDLTPSAWRMLPLMDSPKFHFSAEPYLALEQNLNANGSTDLANDAYIRMRNRLRRERVRNPQNWIAARLAWAADWVLYLLLGYGREPGRALLATLILALVGMRIFRADHMVPQDGNGVNPKIRPPYNALLYSIDVLAPAIELGADKSWQPDPKWKFGQFYVCVHRILGWTLVPLILAAITGIIH